MLRIIYLIFSHSENVKKAQLNPCTRQSYEDKSILKTLLE